MANIGRVIGRVAIKIVPDATDFYDETRRKLKEIEKRLQDLEVEIVPEVDQAAANRVRAELQALATDREVDIGTRLKKSSAVATAAGLALLTKNRKVNIRPLLDTKAFGVALAGLTTLSGLRITQLVMHRLTEELLRLDLSTPIILAVTESIAGLTAVIFGLGAHLFTVVGGLLSMAKAGLALPGILGTMVTGLALTVVAFHDFNRQIPQARRYWDALGRTIQTNFWSTARKPISDLVDELFPALNKLLPETSQLLGTFFGQLATSIGSVMIPMLVPMFEGLNEGLRIAAQHTDAFVGVIARLGVIGAQEFPRLIGWVAEIATKFDNWLDATMTDGRMRQWLNEGVEAIKDFGRVLNGLGKIFRNIFLSAEAAGGASLKEFADGIQHIADVTASSGFADNLTNVFQASIEALKTFRDQIREPINSLVVMMAETFVRLAPVMAETWGIFVAGWAKALDNPKLADNIVSMFEDFRIAVENSVPAFDLIVDKFVVFAPMVGELAKSMSTVLVAAMDSLHAILVSISEASIPLIRGIGELFTDIFNDIKPVADVVASNVLKMGQAFEPLLRAADELWQRLSVFLIPVFKLIVAIIGGAIIGAMQGLTWVFQGISRIIDGFKGVWDGLKTIFSGIKNLDMSQIRDGLKQLFSGLGNILLGALQAVLGGIWTYLNVTILGIVRNIGARLGGGLVAALKTPFASLLAPMKTAFEVLKSVVKGVGTDIKRQFELGKKAFEIFVGVLKAVADWPVFQALRVGVARAFGSLMNWLSKAGEGFSMFVAWVLPVVTAFIAILITKWESIAPIIGAAFDAIATIVQVAMDVISAVVQVAMDYLIPMMEFGWGYVSTVVEKQMEAIWTVIQFLWDAIGTHVTTTMTAIVTGIQVGWAFVQNFVIPVVKILWNAVKDGFNGIVGAITSAMNFLTPFVQGAWRLIRDYVIQPLQTAWNTVTFIWDQIRNSTDGRLSAIKNLVLNGWNAVRRTISEKMSEAKVAVVEKLAEIVSELRGLPAKAKSAIGDLGSVLVGAGRSLIDGFLRGIREKWNEVKSTLTGFTEQIPKLKGPPEKDRVLLTPAGELIIEGFLRGLESNYQSVFESLRQFTLDIASALDDDFAVQVGMSVEGSNAARQSLNSLNREIVGAARERGATVTEGGLSIGNITIPLEDLKQLKDLEEFLDMLRVRARQEAA